MEAKLKENRLLLTNRQFINKTSTIKKCAQVGQLLIFIESSERTTRLHQQELAKQYVGDVSFTNSGQTNRRTNEQEQSEHGLTNKKCVMEGLALDWDAAEGRG